MSNSETAAHLRSAIEGFDSLFANQIGPAREAFTTNDSPFHLLGLGVCSFLEAALGMEAGLMTEASRVLALAEAGAKKKSKVARGSHRFAPGTEWEVLQADAVVLLGLTSALSESYMGYLQCIYSLNSAHSKFTKLYKTVFPSGLDDYKTPAHSPAPSRKASTPSLQSVSTVASTPTVTPPSTKSSFFGRWGSSSLTVSKPPSPASSIDPTTDGPVEDMIVAGTAFGFGLFNLVFSLLPAKIKGVVGFFGFHHDRKLALQALAVSAAKQDVHSVFAGLVLMTYHGVVLLLSGYQADEAHIIKQYRAIVDNIEARYPTGALWILNRAKILRMSNDPEGAIRVLQEGLKPDRPYVFREADTLLVFELAWTLLAQRRYQESADMFIRITKLNSWSHTTYYFIAAGCYFSLNNYKKTQELLDAIPSLLEKKKLNGKDLPTEVYIKKKLAFYKQKQIRLKGTEDNFVEAIRISPAEEISIFWNLLARIENSTSRAHIKEWASLTPAVTIQSRFISPQSTPASPTGAVDLDNPDELAIRSLLLGIVHRTASEYIPARAFLLDAHKRQAELVTSTWVGSMALFEVAVLELKEAEVATASLASPAEAKEMWTVALKKASNDLDQALATATSNNADLSSRLDSRIAMLREEIGTKMEMVGIV